MNDRAIEVIKAYWQNQKGDEKFPLPDSINGDDVEQIWLSCFLIEATNGKFVYTHFGDSLAEAYAKDLHSTAIIEDILYPESPEFTHKLLEVMNTSEPLTYDGAFINFDNTDIKFRKILLPLGDNKITHILGAMLWQAF